MLDLSNLVQFGRCRRELIGRCCRVTWWPLRDGMGVGLGTASCSGNRDDHATMGRGEG
jgi:hypothetical protein